MDSPAPPVILNTGTKKVNIDQVKLHPANPNRGDVALIADSIAVNGFYGHLVVQKSSGYILAGNHRWMAAKKAGMVRVPVTYVDVDDLTAKRILAVDNRASELSRRDEEDLTALLRDIEAAGGLEGSGYSVDDLAELLAVGEHVELPDLPTDKPEFSKLTFYVHRTHLEAVNKALGNFTAAGDGASKNQNGNALYDLCRNYLDESEESDRSAD